MAEKWGKLAQTWVKNGHFPIFRPFFPLFRGRAKIHVSAIFFHFGPEARFGSVQGNRDCNSSCPFRRGVYECGFCKRLSRTENQPKEEVFGMTSGGHPGVIHADIPAKNFGQGGQNPGKTSISARTSMTRRRGRPRS